MMNAIKKISKLPVKEKHVSHQEPASLDGFTLPIGWNFSLMATKCNPLWRCTYHKLTKYRDVLLSFEGKSFQEIERENESNHDWKDFSALRKSFQEEIKNRKIEQEEIWQLRLSSRVRLFGIRKYNIFNVIWLDTNHQAYVVSKRNT